MILKEIALTDFRSFAGTHRFDLMPRSTGGHKRPIVLFGGLNGAGKTSLLTAVRLGLYGRQSLGAGTTVREYHEYLANSIHKSPRNPIQRRDASVELSFRYGRQGVVEDFCVIRSWRVRGGTVSEELGILRDGQLIEGLSYDQAQAFLAELIPIGVSELFFFDGEKIADLAEDDSGAVLREAVRKLLGLDIVERLRNDLSIFIRRDAARHLPEELRTAINALEQRMVAAVAEKDKAADEYKQHQAELNAARLAVADAERRITERGGLWAKSRAAEKERQTDLLKEKGNLEKLLLQEIAGAYPLSLARNSTKALLAELETAAQSRRRKHIAAEVKERLDKLLPKLSSALPPTFASTALEAVRNSFADLTPQSDAPEPALDVSDSQLAKYEYWINGPIPESAKRVHELARELNDVDVALGDSSLRLERAPDEETLAQHLDQLRQHTARAEQARQAAAAALDRVRRHLREAMDINRDIESLQGKLAQIGNESAAAQHAERVQRVLVDFSERVAERRVAELEKHFTEAYRRLARKEDLAVTAEIDPRTFDIALLDERGNRISKKDISAGEKQIYAVAILEALAKTAGRKLPVIIDTPLGRLDSYHRYNIAINYLPEASHQVIVLSTDTEIDRNLYKKIEQEVSHAYRIVFDERSCSSYADEGYFWAPESQESKYAS